MRVVKQMPRKEEFCVKLNQLCLAERLKNKHPSKRTSATSTARDCRLHRRGQGKKLKAHSKAMVEWRKIPLASDSSEKSSISEPEASIESSAGVCRKGVAEAFRVYSFSCQMLLQEAGAT